jgi:hypothetical protein
MECRVIEIKALGQSPGAGNLVICEIVLIHIHEGVLNDQGSIDPFKSDWVARLGGDWYARSSHGLFTVPKPLTTLGIGVDALPHSVRMSNVLSGNDLGLLGNLDKLPTVNECNTARLQMESDRFAGDDKSLTGDDPSEVKAVQMGHALSEPKQGNERERLHRAAQKWIAVGKVKEALALLLAYEASGE